MSLRDEALAIILASKDTSTAAVSILAAGRPVLTYVVEVGVEALKAKHRRAVREELKYETSKLTKAEEEESVKEAARPSSGFQFKPLKPSARRKQKKLRLGLQLLSQWMIGEVALGDMTKEQLLAEADSERTSAAGKMKNATFYSKLAAPLGSRQVVSDYWRPEQVIDLKERIYNGEVD